MKFVIILLAFFSYSVVNASDSSKIAQLPVPSKDALLSVGESDFVKGEASAPITIIEYASLSCSHCASFHEESYPGLKENYIDTGKVRFILRDFPLDEPALRASQVARCAGGDKFYKFVDVMFTTQENWASSKNYLEILANIAKLGGLEKGKFDECISDKELEYKILEGKFFAAKGLDIRSTPTFFINGQKHSGSKSYEYFKKTIDELLEGLQKN